MLRIAIWSITGWATDGPLADTRLERLDHLDTFWLPGRAASPTPSSSMGERERGDP
jgi:hypothetical protein